MEAGAKLLPAENGKGDRRDVVEVCVVVERAAVRNLRREFH